MSLVKCKECKKEISTKAELCPHCGTKVTKRTSAFTWIVLVILILIYNFSTNTLSDVKKANNETKAVETMEDKKKKEKVLLEELKKLPASEIYKNNNKYAELLGMFPSNDRYRKKYKYYSNRVKILEDKIGKSPNVSPWNGVPTIVERYVKNKAKDSSSVEFKGCSSLLFSDIGWSTICQFRAKNSFGALSLEQMKFTMRNDIVFNAYKQ